MMYILMASKDVVSNVSFIRFRVMSVFVCHLAMLSHYAVLIWYHASP